MSLVHDQEIGIEQQRPDDLDALAFADRQVENDAARLELEAILLHDGEDPAFELAGRNAGIHAERDVFEHRHGFKQREMLEHHADADLRAALGLAIVMVWPFQRISPALGCMMP